MYRDNFSDLGDCSGRGYRIGSSGGYKYQISVNMIAHTIISTIAIGVAADVLLLLLLLLLHCDVND